MPRSPILKGVTAAILTVSDSCASGAREDISGPALARLLKNRGAHVLRTEIVSDDKEKIKRSLKLISDSLRIKFVLTTGGTGLGPRDVTPEATRELLEKEVGGLVELMRQSGVRKTKRAALSRAVAGIRGRTLIINLPGSPKGASESFLAIADIIPHALAMMRGEGH